MNTSRNYKPLLWTRGFDIGTAVSYRQSEFGFESELSKIYLRWEYHRLGLGRRMMAETARRFVDRGFHSCILFAELSNPTLGFYDRMGGERLLDDRGRVGANGTNRAETTRRR